MMSPIADQTGPRKGEVYRVEQAFTGLVLTSWRAPFTGGGEKILPVGLRFEVTRDPPPGATGISANPQPYSEWEQRLVNADDREAEKYGGYSLVVTFEQMRRHCVREG